jgi:hypothetical protein
MTFSSSYDLPEQIFHQPHSPAFKKFLHHWFVDTWALSRGEIDLSFLGEFTPEETEIAKNLLRRNLGLRYTHIIEGVAALNDVSAAPILRSMLDEETNASRRLTIAGTLWKLTSDPIFIECLNRMRASDDAILKSAHFHQILWIGDDRAISFLIDLLDDADRFVRYLALSTLNRLEFNQRFLVPAEQLPRQPEDYRRRRHDSSFRQLMTAHLRASNARSKNGL